MFLKNAHCHGEQRLVLLDCRSDTLGHIPSWYDVRARSDASGLWRDGLSSKS